jgi:hypothetical protein
MPTSQNNSITKTSQVQDSHQSLPHSKSSASHRTGLDINNVGLGSAETLQTPFTTHAPLSLGPTSIAQQQVPPSLTSSATDLEQRLQKATPQNRRTVLQRDPLSAEAQKAQNKAKASIRRRVKENAQIRSYRAGWTRVLQGSAVRRLEWNAYKAGRSKLGGQVQVKTREPADAICI